MIPLNVLKVLKVGIVSCSGEAIPGGTVSRSACRKVLDELRPGKTVTICLPLFIAGGSEERKFAADYPTITVDGCEKYCARKSTEKLSGKPARALLIPEILKKHGVAPPKSLRNLNSEEKAAVQVVAEEIARTVDEVLST
ncbi:DGC domain-containing protein [Syntrophus gentianae]|uniref:DGC domain-containing protein n=1 Tax=Syntrophus gentianae TaxID=43775 RepID=A0A1H7ZXI5_9BACT|nr:putative zinc-binding protein [Syntrophus gentianae]SEM63180.1 DGC domain-containing protein [Syntrophus gentianae]